MSIKGAKDACIPLLELQDAILQACLPLLRDIAQAFAIMGTSHLFEDTKVHRVLGEHGG